MSIFTLKRRRTDTEYIGFAESTVGPSVSGWIVKKDSLDPVCLKITCGDEIRVVQADLFRPDIQKRGLHGTGLCGFKVHFSRSNCNVAKVEVLQTVNKLRKARQYFKNERFFLIQMPRTGSSLFNSIVKNALDEQMFMDQIESSKNEWENMTNRQFLSGHIQFAGYSAFFKNKGYRCIVFFREPISQLTSHLNWIRSLQAVKSHDTNTKIPTSIQIVAKHLSQINILDVDELSGFVMGIPKNMYGLFDNVQVRFLANVPADRRVEEHDVRAAINNLREIDLIGLAEKFDDSVRYFSDVTEMTLDSYSVQKESLFTDTLGFDVKSRNLINALKPLSAFDDMLYEVASSYYESQVS